MCKNGKDQREPRNAQGASQSEKTLLDDPAKVKSFSMISKKPFFDSGFGKADRALYLIKAIGIDKHIWWIMERTVSLGNCVPARKLYSFMQPKRTRNKSFATRSKRFPPLCLQSPLALES
jgi:hypothetical protein